jgi:hypothetical protein
MIFVILPMIAPSSPRNFWKLVAAVDDTITIN